MRLQDLAQALPAVVAAALLPGFALATLLGPRWRAWERLAMAPGLSAGFIGFLGLALHMARIPFEPITVLPVLILLGGAAVLRWWRAGPDATVGLPGWLPIPALIAGSVGAAVFVWALHGQVLPPDWDPTAHGGLANGIARTQDVFPLFPLPLQGTAFARARPGFEAMVTVVSWLGGPSPAESMAPVITVTLIVLPLGLTLLALEATGSLALAAVVPLFAIGLAFPSDQAIIGRFPQLVDSTLVAPFIVAAVRLIRGRNALDNALLLAATTASIWVIHGLELLTALVIGGCLLLATAVRCVRASPRGALIRTGIAVVATLAGAGLVTVSTRLPPVPPAIATEPSPVVIPATSAPVHLHFVLDSIAQTDLTSPVAVALYGIGVIALLVRRRMLWVLVAQAVLVLAMVDDYYLHRLSHLWRVFYPWGDSDRILGVQYWLIPLVLGAGLIAVADAMRALSRERRRQVGLSIAALALVLVAFIARHPLGRLWTDVFGSSIVTIYPLGTFDGLAHAGQWVLTMAVATAAGVAAWVAVARRTGLPRLVRDRLGVSGQTLDAAGATLGAVALLFLAVGAHAELVVYQSAVVNRGLATPADLTVLKGMSAALPRGSLVLTDGNDDAGMWMAAVTGLTPLVPNGTELGPLSLPLVVAIAHACDDPAGAEAALRRADAVFVGSHRLPAAQHPWNVDCIARLPDVRLVAAAPWQGTEAAGFAVIR